MSALALAGAGKHGPRGFCFAFCFSLSFTFAFSFLSACLSFCFSLFCSIGEGGRGFDSVVRYRLVRSTCSIRSIDSVRAFDIVRSTHLFDLVVRYRFDSFVRFVRSFAWFVRLVRSIRRLDLFVRFAPSIRSFDSWTRYRFNSVLRLVRLTSFVRFVPSTRSFDAFVRLVRSTGSIDIVVRSGGSVSIRSFDSSFDSVVRYRSFDSFVRYRSIVRFGASIQSFDSFVRFGGSISTRSIRFVRSTRSFNSYSISRSRFPPIISISISISSLVLRPPSSIAFSSRRGRIRRGPRPRSGRQAGLSQFQFQFQLANGPPRGANIMWVAGSLTECFVSECLGKDKHRRMSRVQCGGHRVYKTSLSLSESSLG